MSFDGSLGIADVIDKLTATDGSDVSDDLKTVVAATSSPKIALTAFTIDDDAIKQLNVLAAYSTNGGIGAITGTVTDTNGTYLLADNSGNDATQIAMSADDQITIALTDDAGLTFDATKVTEFEDLVGAAGIVSITGTATTNSEYAEDIGAISDSSQKIAVDFTLSQQVTTVAIAASLVDNTSGDVTFHSTGITNALSGYVNDDGDDLSTAFATVTDHAGNVAITITGINDPITADEITDFNTAVAGTTGAVTATINGTATRLATIDTDNFDVDNGNDSITLNVTTAASVLEFNTLADITDADNITLEAGFDDGITALYDTENNAVASEVSDAIGAANGINEDITLKVSTTVTSDHFAKVNALANINGWLGKVEATISGEGSALQGANLNNLSDSTANGVTADDITFQITGDVTLGHFETIAGRTSRDDITVAGNVTGALSDFYDGDGDKAAFTTLKGHSTDEPISLSSTVEIEDTDGIDLFNNFLNSASGNVTATVADTGDGGVTILAGTNAKSFSWR